MNFHKSCLAVLLFATMIAVGSASAASCSNATLNGVWGFTFAGSGNGTVATTVGQISFDGKGSESGSQTQSVGGTIKTSTFSGTYSVAKNCTGTVVGSDGSTTNFVVDDSNKGAQIISTTSGLVYSGFSLAQGTVTCGLTGKKQTLAANLTGTINGIGQVAAVGQLILDGKGNVSGGGTFSLAGTILPGTISGTYTEGANCTGTTQITPQGLSTLNFSFVVVNGGKEILLIETDSGTTVAGTMQQ